MVRTADLLTVLRDIDAYRGKVCASCNSWSRRGDGGICTLGYRSGGADDSCDDWEQIQWPAATASTVT